MAGKISTDFKGIWCLRFAGLSPKRKCMPLLQCYCKWEARVPDFLLFPPAPHNFTLSVSFHAYSWNGVFLEVVHSEADKPNNFEVLLEFLFTIHCQVHQEGGDGASKFINGPFKIINSRIIFFWGKALLKLTGRHWRIYSPKILSYLYHHPLKKIKQINMGKQ